MTVTLRLATRDDAPAVAALHTESWRFAYRGAYSDEYLDGPVFEDRARVWQDRMSSPPPNQRVILAEDGDALVGFVCAYGADDERWGTLVDNLHVRPDRHRQGTGKRLLAEVAAWCLTEHAGGGLYLWVLDQSARAQAFYQHLGAKDVGTKTSVPPGGGSTVAVATFGRPNSSPGSPRTGPNSAISAPPLDAPVQAAHRLAIMAGK